jgi:NAD/NADP transhydrogenase beta subunit
MNRSLARIIIGGFGQDISSVPVAAAADAQIRSIAAAIQLACASKVAVVPG